MSTAGPRFFNDPKRGMVENAVHPENMRRNSAPVKQYENHKPFIRPDSMVPKGEVWKERKHQERRF